MTDDSTRDTASQADTPADASAPVGAPGVPEQNGEHRHKHVAGSGPGGASQEPDAAHAAPPADEEAPVEPPEPLAEPEPSTEPAASAEPEPPAEPAESAESAESAGSAGSAESVESVESAGSAGSSAESVESVESVEPAEPLEPVGTAGDVPPLLPGDPHPAGPSEPEVARRRLGQAWRPRASRAQLLAGVLCALLGFALVVQARQTQTQGLDSLRQADLVRLLDNVTNAEARAEQDVRDEQAIRDRLASGTDSSAAAQEAARQRLDTLGILAGTMAASGPGIELEISDPRRRVDSSILLDTVEELRDGGAEVIQIGDVRVVASTAFTDDSDGVRVDSRLVTPPYRFRVIGDPQTLARLLQIPGGVLDVLKSQSAQGKVTQPGVVTVDALRPATKPQYARPAQGGAP